MWEKGNVWLSQLTTVVIIIIAAFTLQWIGRLGLDFLSIFHKIEKIHLSSSPFDIHTSRWVPCQFSESKTAGQPYKSWRTFKFIGNLEECHAHLLHLAETNGVHLFNTHRLITWEDLKLGGDTFSNSWNLDKSFRRTANNGWDSFVHCMFTYTTGWQLMNIIIQIFLISFNKLSCFSLKFHFVDQILKRKWKKL